MSPWLIGLLRFLAALGLALFNGVVLIYMLRRVLGRLHVRIGPNEVGPQGIFQTLCDVGKIISKEEIIPDHVDKPLYKFMPFLVFAPALLAYMVIPFSATWIIMDSEFGLLFLFGISSLVPVAFLGVSWASNNKYALLGGIRAIGSQITYEVPLLLSMLPVAMMAGSLNLKDIVLAQQSLWFIIPQFPAFLIFLVAGLAELNQIPFDMSEAEGELVGGWSTEYSSMRFGIMYLAEFSNSFILAAAIVTLFLGGWQTGIAAVDASIAAPIIFMIKTYIIIFFIMVIRGTWPRPRIDQYLHLGWKYLMPASLAWILISGLVIKLVQIYGGAA